LFLVKPVRAPCDAIYAVNSWANIFKITEVCELDVIVPYAAEYPVAL